MQRYKKDKRWGIADKSFLVSLHINKTYKPFQPPKRVYFNQYLLYNYV